MKNGYNKVIIIGTIANDPELQDCGNDRKVFTISVSTIDSHTDKNGIRKEEVDYHKVVCWGKIGEKVSIMFQQGDEIFLEGKLKNRNHVQADGKKIHVIEIVCINFQ